MCLRVRHNSTGTLGKLLMAAYWARLYGGKSVSAKEKKNTVRVSWPTSLSPSAHLASCDLAASSSKKSFPAALGRQSVRLSGGVVTAGSRPWLKEGGRKKIAQLNGATKYMHMKTRLRGRTGGGSKGTPLYCETDSRGMKGERAVEIPLDQTSRSGVDRSNCKTGKDKGSKNVRKGGLIIKTPSENQRYAGIAVAGNREIGATRKDVPSLGRNKKEERKKQLPRRLISGPRLES